ncbi:dnaJ homolog subfamily C member 16-like [Rhopilema esculentum]|uniref:dnaJ homolog subfamily C member 16-like n=1 Tax=Rhopilema esculentum TaxID=499914 RepID=UPI0031D9A6ED
MQRSSPGISTITFWLICGLIVLLFASCSFSEEFDPYFTLGLRRDASNREIRRAYKALARKWHPDKNKNPKAQEMFMKVTDSYNILSNEERRYNYDNFGMTKEQPSGQHSDGYHSPFGFHSNANWMPFSDSFFGNMGNKNIQILTNQLYEKTVLPMSYKAPQMIYIYGDWCFQCMQLELIWESVANDMTSLGIGFYELNYQYSRTLNSRLGVRYYPQFLAVFEGKVLEYNMEEYSKESFRLFVWKLIPQGLVKQLNKENYIEFFRQCFIDNKPQAILFSNKIDVPLLFSLIAYQYHQKIAFAYVNSARPGSDGLLSRYGVQKKEQLFLILKEEPSVPEVILKGSSLSQKAIHKAISENLYFHLPRLSSQEIFDSICPVSSEYYKRYCVLLFTFSRQDHSYQRYLLRKMAKDMRWKERNVQFMYINEDIQKNFRIDDAKSDGSCQNGEQALKVLVFLRLSSKRILYDWLHGGFCPDDPEDPSVKLASMLEQLVGRKIDLSREANISAISDEHQPHLFYRISKHMSSFFDHVVDSYQFFSWSSPVSMIINSMLIGIVLVASVLLPLAGRSSSQQEEEVDCTVLGIKKLTSKNSKELITNAPPGRFTVIILLDAENLSQVEDSPIMQAFSDATYTFVRGELITFAWLSIQEQLSWCAEVMDIREFGKVLPGTVIAVNGRKKYLHVFKPNGNVNHERLADFIGLESDNEIDDDELDGRALQSQKIAVISIRNFLGTWLERLCDGTLTDRMRVDNWPKLEL